MNVDFITSGAPPAAMIRRNEGSVSQVMTDVQLLGGQPRQNMTNYGVSDASGLNGHTNNPAAEAILTVPRLFPSVKTITDAPLV